jgi:hypothetical protein
MRSLYGLYPSLYVRIIGWTGHVAGIWKRGALRVLVGRPEGKMSLGRPRCRWQHHIKIDLKDAEWTCMEWMALAQIRGRLGALVNAVMNLQVS